MTVTDTLGRAAVGAACAVLASLASCAGVPVAPGQHCARWRLILEPRLTVSMDPSGDAKPIASITARPACAKLRNPTS